MMGLQRPVFWHQGLFLQPQHFQRADRSVRSLFIPYQSYLTPHFWGVCRMTLDNDALGTRSFEISRGAFLFQDGTHAVLPGNALMESRSFEEGMISGDNSFIIYLGLKKWDDSAGNVTPMETCDPLSGIATRFAAPADGEPCADLHAGGPQGEVRQLSLVLKIFWETELELLGDYLLIPVARLERTRDGMALSRRFVPPCLTMAGSSLLLDTVREIRDQLASRGRRLEGYKRQRGIQAAEFGSKDMIYLLALRTLNRYLAQLVHFIDAGEVHPWQVYGILRQLVGELSTFSETVTVLGESAADGTRVMPCYDHLNLGACFGQARDLILKLLDQITAGPEYALPLSYDGAYFGSEMKPAHFESRNRFYLVLKTGEDPKSIIQSVASSAKLSTRERLPLLIAQALPGVRLEHLPIPPQELPRSAFSIYFAIDGRSEQWDMVRKWNNIALCWDQAPADLEVEVMIVARS